MDVQNQAHVQIQLRVGLALVLGVVKLFKLIRAQGTTIIFSNSPYRLETL